MIDTVPSKTALIVLGMHRSGTSALAGVLGHLGAALPRDLMAASNRNAKGFFESNLVMNLNDRILESAGSNWWDIRRIPLDWLETQAAASFLDSAQEVLHSDFQDAPLFVLKDPRICRLMPFWKRALDRFGARIMVVHTHRPPLDMSASLTRWSGHETDYNLVLWLRHVLDAEADSRDLPRVFTSYHGLLENWELAVDHITRGLEIHWPRSAAEAHDEIADFLSRDLQHFSGLAADDGRDALPAALRTTLDLLDRWAAKAEDAGDHGTLDDLQARLDLVAPLYEGPALRSAERRVEIETLTASLAQANASLAQANASLAQTRELLAQGNARHEALVQQHADLRSRHAAMEGKLSALSAQSAILTSSLSAERDAALERARQREAEFLNSTSWRVTAPLRFVSRMVRRSR